MEERYIIYIVVLTITLFIFTILTMKLGKDKDLQNDDKYEDKPKK